MTENKQELEVFQTPCLAAHVQEIMNNTDNYAVSIEFLIESGAAILNRTKHSLD
jgi:hypothetical protein